MEEEHSSGRKVATLETTCRILESLLELEGGTVTRIAERTGLAKGTVHAHLKTLRANDYISKTGDEYDVGLGFLDFGLYARDRIEGFPVIRRKAEALAEETEELVVFITEENGRGVVLLRERGTNAVETEVRTGNRVPLHVTAGGKAIMAHWPRERVEELIERRGLPEKTDRSITDERQLFEELDEARARGYAANVEEHTTGLQTFSAPITGGDDLIGALSVCGPTNRMQNNEYRDELIEYLLGAANELELKIKYG